MIVVDVAEEEVCMKLELIVVYGTVFVVSWRVVVCGAVVVPYSGNAGVGMIICFVTIVC